MANQLLKVDMLELARTNPVMVKKLDSRLKVKMRRMILNLYLKSMVALYLYLELRKIG